MKKLLLILIINNWLSGYSQIIQTNSVNCIDSLNYYFHNLAFMESAAENWPNTVIIIKHDTNRVTEYCTEPRMIYYLIRTGIIDYENNGLINSDTNKYNYVNRHRSFINLIPIQLDFYF